LIQGFEKGDERVEPRGPWRQKFDRKIRLGIVGHGACRFGAHFSLQDHPNVEVAAVSDLFADRRAELADACRCDTTYQSLDELLEDDSIEAVFCATDAPAHAEHAIRALEHGKHVACAVPAVFERLEDADRLFEAVRSSGLNYMMFETSYFRADLFAMRQAYEAGALGRLVYVEGEYYHHAASVLDSHRDWRVGMPPQFYPTHANAYQVGVDGARFTDVSCIGIPSSREELQPSNNRYGNSFGTEVAMLRTTTGGIARMAVSWDTPGLGGEVGRVRGNRGSMTGTSYEGAAEDLPVLSRPALPPSVERGGHGGSHGYLANEFALSILEERRPLIDIGAALNMSVAGIVAHRSALKDGERLEIPQYEL
jgi:hypothetical protein